MNTNSSKSQSEIYFSQNSVKMPFYIIVFLFVINLLFSINPGPAFTDVDNTGWILPDPNIEKALIEEGKAGIVISPHLPPICTTPMDSMKNFSSVRQQPGEECVAFSLISLMEYYYKMNPAHSSKDSVRLSPLDFFCNIKEKEIELNHPFLQGDPCVGTSIYVAAKYVLREHGVYPENCYPCSSDCGSMCTCDSSCETECKSYITSRGYTFIDSNPDYQYKIAAMKSCLAQGKVFVAGIPIFSNYDGISKDIPNPTIFDNVDGGHALCFVGYEDSSSWPGDGYFWFKNSWGEDWGDDGYGRVSYEFMKLYAREIVFIDDEEIKWSPYISGSDCDDACLYNNPPEIKGIKILNIDIGVNKPLNFLVFAIDPDDDDITYDLQNPPTGATLDPQSGQFSWTPKASGSYPIKIKVADYCGSTDEAYTVTVPGPCPRCDSCCSPCPRCDSCCKSFSTEINFGPYSTTYNNPYGYPLPNFGPYSTTYNNPYGYPLPNFGPYSTTYNYVLPTNLFTNQLWPQTNLFQNQLWPQSTQLFGGITY